MVRKIILQRVSRPKSHSVRDDLYWMCDSLGFMSGRDTEHMSFKIMQELLDQLHSHDIVATQEIAEALDVEAPRVNHHVRNLMDSGILLREKRKVVLRGGSLTAAIEEMKRDSNQMFDHLIEVAKEIDKNLDN